MSEEIKVPTNAVEAQELHADLSKLNGELNTFLNENEPNWNAECEAKFEAMQADEAAMAAAADKYVNARKAADDRRSKVQDRQETFEALLRDPQATRESFRRQVDGDPGEMDRLNNMSDREVQDVALKAFVCQWSNDPVSDEQREALKVASSKFSGRARWSAKEATLLTPDDVEIQDIQRRVITNTLGVTSPASTVTGSGSKLFNSSFVTTLEEARLAYGGMNAVSDIMTTESGEKITWPTVDDTGNTGAIIAQSTAPSAADPTFGEVSWGAYKISSKEIKVTRELIEDNQVRLLSRIAEMLGTRIGRAENNLFTLGDGSSKPTGLMSVVPTGVTATSETAIVFDEIIDLEHSIDPSRRNMGCSYMMNDTTLKLIRKLKDAELRYLWQVGTNTGAPNTLNGYNYVINQDMADAATSAKPLVFGYLPAFKIRRVKGIRLVVTDELYARTDEVGFFAWVRVDSNLLDAGDDPIACLTMDAGV